MLNNLSPESENHFQKFDENGVDIRKLLFGAVEMLSDFSYLTACPSYIVDYTDDVTPKPCAIGLDGIIGKINKGFDQLFEEFKANCDESAEFYEFTYLDFIKAVAMPIMLRGKVFGFVIYGGFVIEEENKDSKLPDSVKLVNKKRADLNLHRASKFVSVLANQITAAYELNLQIKQNQKSAEELRLQKVFFENLFENSPEAIVILDNEDKVIRANKEFEKLFEYSKEEILSKLINDIIVPENFKEEGRTYTQQASLGETLEFTTVRQTKYGKQIHVQVTGKPIFLDNEKIAVYAIYRNITEQVWNQKQEKIIYGITDLLNSTQSQIDLVHSIGELLQPVIGTGEMFLELISPTKRSLRVFNQKSADYKNLSFSESISFSVLRRKKKLNLDENQIKELAEVNRLTLANIPKRWIGFPLIVKDVVLGVFGVSSLTSHSNLDADTLKLLELVSLQLAAGVSRRKKELELKTLNRSMEQSPASIVITNRDGDIEYVNPKFCQISGYSADEVIGKNPRILKSGFTPKEVYEQMWAHLVRGEEWNCEFLNVKKNKELYWERASFSAIKDEFGKITHYMATKEDITEHKKFEKDLLEAKNKAEESDRMKSAFLANVSHELRTPLNAVIGFSNLCNESMGVEEILEFVQLINKSGNQLLEIIEDILNFTMIESGGMERRDEEFLMVNFFKEVKKLAAEKQKLENKERLELRFVPDSNYSKVLVKTDFQRLIHVVMNLLKNGLKFTNEGSVEFGYQVHGKRLKLYVKDTGVGIEKDKKDIIFDRFRQVDESITRTFGGTGMGLAISKKIMDMLDGHIEVESEPNKGSTFTLLLDCILSTEKKEKEQSSKPANTNKKPTILVAEDELSNFRLIEAILRRSNYNVIRAENGAEAIRMCKNQKEIDLVLMDMRMPDVDGMEATLEIKKFKPGLTIIAQTAYAMNGDKDKALELGCDDYISKPIKKDLLLSKLETYIKR
ncbi:PAS domain S-box protein [Marinifilum caeruleilacunae]|uniref:histidine kinase n=1 Tax=Marinifilum caeruleilacunae TaxID=2499076 RepID=A0ABX1WYJ4_9BACT|nr:PAS domain S-box protein [Marinifilum caeruleilacunae]NOU61203.1 PAS domain S-box protein [Marinifilum caeruleilacunae]